MTPKLQLDQHEIVEDETSLSIPVDGYYKIRYDHKGLPEGKSRKKSTGCVCLAICILPGAPDFNSAFAQTLFTG